MLYHFCRSDNMDQTDNIEDLARILRAELVHPKNIKWQIQPFMGSIILVFIKLSLTSEKVYDTFLSFVSQHAVVHFHQYRKHKRSLFRINDHFIMHCWEVFKGKTILSSGYDHYMYCPDAELNTQRIFLGELTNLHAHIDVSYNDGPFQTRSTLLDNSVHAVKGPELSNDMRLSITTEQKRPSCWINVVMGLIITVLLVSVMTIIGKEGLSNIVHCSFDSGFLTRKLLHLYDLYLNHTIPITG